MSLHELNDIFVTIRTRQGDWKLAEQSLMRYSESADGLHLTLQFLGSRDVYLVSDRLQAAIFLKNFFIKKWSVLTFLTETLRSGTHQALLQLILSSEPSVQKQLFDCVRMVLKSDFDSWPVVSQLQQHLEAMPVLGDVNQILTIYKLLEVILEDRYSSGKSNETLHELITMVLPHLFGSAQKLSVTGNSVFGLMLNLTDRLTQETTDTNMIVDLLSCLLNCVYWICHVDLPENVELFYPQLMGANGVLMKIFSNPLPRSEKVLKLLAVAAEFLSHGIRNYCDELEPYVLVLTRALVTLLRSFHAVSAADEFASSALSFLTVYARAMWSGEHQCDLLHEPEVLQTILVEVVLRNVVLSPEEFSLFEEDPMDFFKQDVECGDGNRRAAALSLLSALKSRFPEQTTAIMREQVAVLSQTAHSDARIKDALICFLKAMTAEQQSRTYGVTVLSDVGTFMHCKELTLSALNFDNPADVDNNLYFKCAAFKFVGEFKNCFDDAFLLQVLQIGAFVFQKSQQPVLLAYAAHCCDSLLNTYVAHDLTKVVQGIHTMQQHTALSRQTSLRELRLRDSEQCLNVLCTMAPTLLTAVSNVTADAPREVEMVLLWRSVQLLNARAVQFAPAALKAMAATLEHMKEMRVTPRFVHFFFETIASLVRALTSQNQANSAEADALLTDLSNYMFGIVNNQAARDTDLPQYALQILQAIMHYAKSNAVQQLFVGLLDTLLDLKQWTQSLSCSEAVLSLITAFFENPILRAVAEAKAMTVLSWFKHAMYTARLEAAGFLLLNNILRHITPTCAEQIITPLVSELVFRIQAVSKNPSVALRLKIKSIVALSVAVVKFGPRMVAEAFNKTNPGLAHNFFSKVWLAQMADIESPVEKKVAVVALVQCLSEQLFIESSGPANAVGLSLPEMSTLVLKALVQILDLAEKDHKDAWEYNETAIEQKTQENAVLSQHSDDFEPSFSRLFTADPLFGRRDFVPEVPSLARFLAQQNVMKTVLNSYVKDPKLEKHIQKFIRYLQN